MSPSSERPTSPRTEADTAYALGEISGKLDSLSVILRSHIEASAITWRENREQWSIMSSWQRNIENKVADVMSHGLQTSRRVEDLEKNILSLDDVRQIIREELEPFKKDVENFHAAKTTPIKTDDVEPEARTAKWLLEKLLIPLINPIVTAIIIYILLQVIPSVAK
jgi:hypothetical protein